MAAINYLTVAIAVLAICVGISAHPHVFEGHEHHQGLRNHRFGEPPAPRFWVRCNVTESPEPVCSDCHTRLVCTKLGGFLIPCWLPGNNHCAAGECGPEPSDECAPTTSEPAEQTTTEYYYDNV